MTQKILRKNPRLLPQKYQKKKRIVSHNNILISVNLNPKISKSEEKGGSYHLSLGYLRWETLKTPIHEPTDGSVWHYFNNEINQKVI